MATSENLEEKTSLLKNKQDNLTTSYSSRLNIASDVESIEPQYARELSRQHSRSSDSNNGYAPVCDHEIEPNKMLDSAIESFEYDMHQNNIFIKERENNAKNWSNSIDILRYFILFLIGFFTGLAAFTIDVSIESLSSLKFRMIGDLIDRNRNGPRLSTAGFIWCLFCAVMTALAGLMVVFLSPVSAGSGIPQIKCYLNGINVPFVMRFLAIFTKGAGVVLAVVGGLAVGKEGPMIHMGAAIAAGISQGRLTLFRKSAVFFRPFRNDQEKRDFVSAGAAAGVAAAFGAPVGGLLFSLEEGASFVNQRLTWKILFSSMVSMFTLSLFISIKNRTFRFNSGGLISFGQFTYLDSYTTYEILVFILIGFLGGVLGSLFNKINLFLSKLRKKYMNTRLTKVLEAGFVAYITAALGFTAMIYWQDCRTLGKDYPLEVPLQMFCSDSEYNSVGSLFFQTPEKSLRALFHDQTGSYDWVTLAMFAGIYFLLACYTYGIAVPSGLFIPCLLCGAAWGRAIGVLLNHVLPDMFPDPGKFALIGAAAQLGGVVRMTVSLTVILMEATGNIIVGLPLLITLNVAKYVGDTFNEGIYDLHIDLMGYALLPWQPHEMSVSKKAYDVMSSPVISLRPVMKVGDLIYRVCRWPHHAFPIVDGPVDPDSHLFGTLLGLISKEHLALIVQKKVFSDENHHFGLYPQLSIKDYDHAFPRFPVLKDVALALSDEEKEMFIDLCPYMNSAPYRVPETMTMNRVFNLFRLLGLRHLPVVDNTNQVRGMITRKDLCRFRFEPKNGEIFAEELLFSRQT